MAENKKINTFAENMAELTESVNSTLQVLNALNEAAVSDDTTIDVSINDEVYKVPSYSSILTRVKAVENSVNSIVTGDGVAKVISPDGTVLREIKASSVAKVPSKITGVSAPTTFGTTDNYFFEEMLFPKLVVSFDLKGCIDDNSDRVIVKRLILDANDSHTMNIYADFIEQSESESMTYGSVYELLSSNSCVFYEDEEEISVSLAVNMKKGVFNVDTYEREDNDIVFYVDSISYSVLDANGNVLQDNMLLAANDLVRHEDTIYTVKEVRNTGANGKYGLKVSVYSGVDNIGKNAQLNIYEPPFSSKVIKVGVKPDEANIMFIKGINDDFNLISDEWSDPIYFITNELVMDGDASESLTLKKYYLTSVSDFSEDMLSKIENGYIPTSKAVKPNTPTLVSGNFKVVQINTQINAALENTDLESTVSEIETLSNSIKEIRTSISNYKAQLLETTSTTDRSNIQSNIDNATKNLETASAEYSSLVQSFKGTLSANGALNSSPKYRIRGFFSIPQLKYTYEDSTTQYRAQEIIAFDVMYRYLKLDETGVALNTFEYTDDNGNTVNGVFSDWNMHTSVYKERKYNSETSKYEWQEYSVSDGTKININQIDLPITEGEKVEFKVRAISEAGYPDNPIKSDWSNSVIISFPSEYTTNNALANMIDEVNSQAQTIAFNDTMKAAGLISHVSDELAGTADDTNASAVIYKHLSNNIGYVEKDGMNSKIISLSDKIDSLITLVNSYTNFMYSISDSLSESYNEMHSISQAITRVTVDASGNLVADASTFPTYLEDAKRVVVASGSNANIHNTAGSEIKANKNVEDAGGHRVVKISEVTVSGTVE